MSETRIIVATPYRVYAWFEKGTIVKRDNDTFALEAPIDSMVSRIEAEKLSGRMPKLSLRFSKSPGGEFRIKIENITFPYPHYDRTSVTHSKTLVTADGRYSFHGVRFDYEYVQDKLEEVNRVLWKRTEPESGFQIFSNLPNYEHGYSCDVARYVSPALVIKKLLRKRIYAALNQNNRPLVDRLNDREFIHEFYFDEDGDLKVRSHNLMSTIDTITTYEKEIKELESV